MKTAAVAFVFYQPLYCFALCLFLWNQRLYLLSSLAGFAACRFKMTQFHLHQDCLFAGKFASFFLATLGGGWERGVFIRYCPELWASKEEANYDINSLHC